MSDDRDGTLEARTFRLSSHDVVVERLLGQGGMGTVYRVRERSLGRPAALKLIRGQQDPRKSRRFAREVLVTARLDHPNIPPVYEAGRTATGEEYMLMRLVDGRELSELIADAHRSRDPEQLRGVLACLVKVSEAVAYAHSRGVVHRDLKPQNVMVGAFGEVLVLDWGLARLLGESAEEDASLRVDIGPEDSAALTQDGAFVGTPGFMSPEQALGEDVDARSDVFALGAILTKALTDHLPFPELPSSESLSRHAQGSTFLPPKAWAGVPGELRAIAEKALAFSRDERYPDAEALVADLQGYLEGRPVSVHRYTTRERAARLVRQHPALFSGVAVASLLSLVVAWVTARAEETARVAVAQRAEEEALAAWTELEENPSQDISVRLGQALAALQAAQRRRTLRPEDPDAAEALFDAAFALGGVANAGEQWALSRHAFSQAVGLGVDDARAKGALRKVDQLRTAEGTRRREAIEEVLADAERGALSERSDGFQDAAFLIGRYPESQTVRLLGDALGRVSESLREVERETYMNVASPSDDERAIGQAMVLSGLGEAVRRRAAEAPTAADEAVLAQAEERLRRRALRRLSTGERIAGGRVAIGVILAKRQTESLSSGTFDLARIACDSLGRLGIHARALEALEGYLAAERDPVRAARAGLALCRLGGARAQRAAFKAIERFGEESSYGAQIRRALGSQVVVVSPGDRATSDRADPEGNLERADGLRVRGEYANALAAYERAIQFAPKAPAGWLGRARCKAALGDHRGALDDYASALARDPANAEAYARRSTSDARLGLLADAQRDSDKALELDPSQADAWLTRARLHVRAKHLKQAHAALDEVIARSPQIAAAWELRARVWINEGDLELARRDIEQSLRLDPESPRALVVRGYLQPTSAARHDFERAFELDPHCADALAALGVQACSSKDYDRARDYAARALKEDPDLPEALALRAMLLCIDGKRAAARVVWSQVKDQAGWTAPGIREELKVLFSALAGDFRPGQSGEPRTAAEFMLQGTLAYGAKKWRLSKRLLTRAIDLDPKNAMAFFFRARARQQIKGANGKDDAKGALNDLKRAVALEDWRANFWFERGMQRFRMGRHKLAISDFTGSLQRDPANAVTWIQRAHCKSLLEDYEGAAEDFKEGLRRDPNHKWGWHERANADYELERYADVIKDVGCALKIDRKAARRLLFLRGMSRGREGDTRGAVKDLRAFVREHPKAQRARRARQQIKTWSSKGR